MASISVRLSTSRMREPLDSIRLVTLVTGVQNRLYAYFLAVTGDPDAAGDLLQETNVVLCKKVDQFEPGTDFGAWAIRIARYEALDYRRRLGRDRHVFDDDVAHQIADTAADSSADIDDQVQALQQCLPKLPDRQRQVVRRRYESGESVRSIASSLGMTENALAQLLHRARLTLAACVEAAVSQRGRS